MTRTPSRRKPREAAPQDAPSLPAVVPPAARAGSAPQERSEPHLHAALDRGAMASLARFTGGLSPHAMIDAWSDWAMHLARAPGRQLELAERAQANALKLAQYATAQMGGGTPEKHFAPGRYDTRWRHEGWESAPFALCQQGFLATQDWWHAATADLRGLRKQNADRTGFMMRQLLDTVSPANFPLSNPEIIDKTRATGGRNLMEGAAHWTDDACHILAQEHRPVPEAFALGEVLAATPGKVVWRNDLMELIQYSPTTDEVQAEPVLIVPAWIMKYYILDLSPENSFIRWLVGRDRDDRLASVTLMAAQVDFAEAGELLLFLDESQVAFLEDLMWSQGYLDRPQMSGAFAAIRSEDLIWSRAVRRYFLGEPDLPTDVTVWVNDTTRMPARMHSEYLRGIFLENRISAGRFAVEGRVIALKDISVPIFVVGTETDHIAPWRSVYKTALFTDCDMHFLLTKGGHNGGILSEPGHKRRHYRVGHRPAGALYRDPDTWLAAHEPVQGSWWPEWERWLSRHGSGTVPARAPGGHEDYPALGDAPGSYIHQI